VSTAPAALPEVGALGTGRTPTRSRRGIPGLRGTGLVGHVCALVIAVAAVIAILGPSLAPHDPFAVSLLYANVGPIPGHVLGFDGAGRDLASRLLVGARTSLYGPLLVALASVGAGTILAIACAWLGGLFDTVVSTILDVLFAFPGILLAVLAAAVFGAGLTSAVIALAVAYSPYVARVLRGVALRERASQYIAALEVQGFSAVRICVRHLVPNVLGLIVAQGTILFGYAMVDLAAISYLGLGVKSPHPDWGVMVADGQAGVLQGYPAVALSAGLCILVVVVAVNVLGERLNERASGGRR
jgi:peptide/nickel transport system permease protein